MPIEIEMSFAFEHSLATIEKLSLVKKASMKKLRIYSAVDATGQWSFDSNSNIKKVYKLATNGNWNQLSPFVPLFPKDSEMVNPKS